MLLDDALTHAKTIPFMSSWRLSITWPLFQAGLAFPHGEHTKKDWLLREVNANFRTLGCSHDRHIIDALEQAWSADVPGYEKVTIDVQRTEINV